MTAPLDHLAVLELARLLGRISTANGFSTDAGFLVLTEESLNRVDDDAMLLEVLDPEESAEYQSCAKRIGVLRIIVKVTVPAELPTARQTIRRVLADCRQALADTEQHDFPAGITKLEIGGRRINPREDGSAWLEGELDIAVTIQERHKESLS
jgi:hypothetical protein